MAINKFMPPTPTETLILELLVARYRLGEQCWTFDSAVRRQVESLAEKGYVSVLNGIVPKTVRAVLTPEAVAVYLTYDYVPPIAAGNPEMTGVFRRITQDAVELKNSLEASEGSELLQ